MNPKKLFKKFFKNVLKPLILNRSPQFWLISAIIMGIIFIIVYIAVGDIEGVHSVQRHY
jgi:hypothetical protein